MPIALGRMNKFLETVKRCFPLSFSIFEYFPRKFSRIFNCIRDSINWKIFTILFLWFILYYSFITKRLNNFVAFNVLLIIVNVMSENTAMRTVWRSSHSCSPVCWRYTEAIEAKGLLPPVPLMFTQKRLLFTARDGSPPAIFTLKPRYWTWPQAQEDGETRFLRLLVSL